MKKNNSDVAKLSNAFSTGGGGGNFERHVQAVFILALLIDGFSPEIDAPVTRLDFQGKHHGYNIDDLIVTAETDVRTRKLLCQIKHSIQVTENDRVFQEVVTAAWKDYKSTTFKVKTDKIALITSFLAKDTVDALRYIHDQACKSIDEVDFINRMDLPVFSGSKKQEKFQVIKECLKKANNGSCVSDSDLWGFCKTFVLMIFDLDYAASVNLTLIQSLIKCRSKQDPATVWAVLSETAGEWNQAAASVSRSTIPEKLLAMFGINTMVPNLDSEYNSFQPDEFWAKLALIGAWDESKEADISILEKVMGYSSEDLQKELQKRLAENKDKLSLQNGIWQVLNRRKLLDSSRNLYFDSTIKNVVGVVSSYIVEKSRQFSEDGEYDNMIPAQGRFVHSDLIRKSLLQGLCLLTNGQKPSFCSDRLLINESTAMIQTFFKDCNWIRIASAGDLLLLLAELNPDSYLKCLESYICANREDVGKLFPKKNHDVLMRPNFITDILFSLELLAWSDQCLVKVIRCLGELEQIPYDKTNYANTPANSIAKILLPYMPQTTATPERQVIAVRALNTDMPGVCWKVVKKLLPKGTTMAIDSPKPQFMQITIPKEEKTNSAANELFEEYIHLAIDLAGKDAVRLAQLAEYSLYMSKADISTYVENILQASEFWGDDERFAIWLKLSDLRSRIIAHHDYSIPDGDVFAKLTDAVIKMTPNSIFYRHRRLFLSDYHDEPWTEDRWRREDAAKSDAVYEIYSELGIDDTIEFGRCVNDLYDVARRLGEKATAKDVVIFLDEYQKEYNDFFYSSIIKSYLRIHGVSVLRDFELSERTVEFRAKVLMDAPITDETMALLPQFLPDNEGIYWSSVSISRFSPIHLDCDVKKVASELLRYNRPIAVINAVGAYIDQISIDDETIYKALLNASTQESIDEFDPYSVRSLIECLQNSQNLDIERLSNIEFIYLPLLGRHYDISPKALRYRISNEPEVFCSIIEAAYKPRHSTEEKKELPPGISERLFEITYQFSVIPGVNWSGIFSAEVFEKWISEVKAWAKENDRYEVALQIVGNGLSYAEKDSADMIADVIMKALNAADNEEMRKGYELGIINQRGVHWVDPEGKEEKALAEKFFAQAANVEERGYTRFAEVFKSLGERYLYEADCNARRIDELTGKPEYDD